MLKKIISKFNLFASRSAVALASILKSPHFWLLFMALGSGFMFCSGVYSLYGAGWAKIAASGFCMLYASVIFKGLNNA